MTTLRPTITFLGAGSMGSSVLQGLLSGGFETASIRVTTRSEASAAARQWPPVVQALSLEVDPHANRAAVEGADIVIIGVKPHMVAELLEEIADALAPGAVVVSLAAAVSTARMEAVLPAQVAVVRTMPNTPTAVGFGVTALSRGTRTSDEQVALVERMFSAVGTAVVVDETQMDAVTGVSGSGPAYVYFMVESFIRGAEVQGFSPEEAERLVLQTFRGALEMLQVTGRSPEQLRREVTSPNGTTERAIAVLQRADLPGVLTAAVEASAARSRELSAP